MSSLTIWLFTATLLGFVVVVYALSSKGDVKAAWKTRIMGEFSLEAKERKIRKSPPARII
jgi:hypothetical protein